MHAPCVRHGDRGPTMHASRSMNFLRPDVACLGSERQVHMIVTVHGDVRPCACLEELLAGVVGGSSPYGLFLP